MRKVEFFRHDLREEDLQAAAETMRSLFLTTGPRTERFEEAFARYLGAPAPSAPLENRSLVKYRLIIDEFGGWDQLQKVLETLRGIADRHGVGIAEVAARYILQKKPVAAVIIGARNRAHLPKLMQLFQFNLDSEDLEKLGALAAGTGGPAGPVYGLERDRSGKHGRVMKYNLNAQSPSETDSS